jgi:predicted ABC-type ATPase
MAGINLDKVELTDNGLLIIVGGSHGAGKSTYCRALMAAKPLPYLTPAELESELDTPTSRQELLKLLRRKALECISRHQSFYFEHIMSGNYVGKLIANAKAGNFNVHLVYINIENASRAIERIDGRIALNGHDVERDKIEARLNESRANFYKKYAPLADSWELLDNNGASYRRIASRSSKEDIVIELDSEYEHFKRFLI